MRRRLLSLVATSLAVAAAVAVATGCKQGDVLPPPPTLGAQDKSLEALKQRIIMNSAGFLTFRADCEVALRSPLVKSVTQVNMNGKMFLSRPRKIYVDLWDAGALYMKLVGDGSAYKVQMPVFRLEYAGRYDEAVQPTAGRVHFLPDDLADALDPAMLFNNRTQVLRAYPRRWDLLPGAGETPIIFPATWAIDSIAAPLGGGSAIVTLNSIELDRASEDIVRIDKFRPDGSLRTRIWILKRGLAYDEANRSVQVPTEMLIWYPWPLEGTIVRLRLTNMKINVPEPENLFKLSG
jgi:hypothetical protein